MSSWNKPAESAWCVYGSVAADGSPISGEAVSSVVRLGVGEYEVKLVYPMDSTAYGVLATAAETVDEDSIEIHYRIVDESTIVFTIHEGDNGPTAGVRQDRAFTFGVPCGPAGPACVSGAPCEQLSVTVQRPTDTPVTGWANQNITGTVPTNKACFTITAATGPVAQMMGLNSDPNTSTSYQNIDHNLYIYENGTTRFVRVYESGSLRFTGPNWVVGDTICVERVGGAVEYSLNGTVFYTSPTVSTADLFIDSSFYYAAGFWGTGSISLDVAGC